MTDRPNNPPIHGHEESMGSYTSKNIRRDTKMHLFLFTMTTPGRVEHDQHMLLFLKERLEGLVVEVHHVGGLL